MDCREPETTHILSVGFHFYLYANDASLRGHHKPNKLFMRMIFKVRYKHKGRYGDVSHTLTLNLYLLLRLRSHYSGIAIHNLNEQVMPVPIKTVPILPCKFLHIWKHW